MQSGAYHIMYVSGEHSQFTIHYGQFTIIIYVNEHQLPHVVNASHTMPTTRVNQGPMLLKLIEWRHCLCFR